MLIPELYITIYNTLRGFDSNFEKGLWLRDNLDKADRILTMRYAESVEIEESFNSIGKTCTLIIPRDVKFTLKPITQGAGEGTTLTGAEDFLSSAEAEDVITAGCVVVIETRLSWSQNGQYGRLPIRVQFKGFISTVTPSDSLVITCEDDAWLLKQVKKTITYPKGTVLDMVKDMCKGIIAPENIRGGSLTDQSEAQFVASGYRLKRNPTIYQALHGLYTNFKIRCFFKDGILYVGKLWYEADSIRIFNEAQEDGRPLRFMFQHNIIADKLTYKKKDDYKKGVEVTVIDSNDNSRFTVYAGDESGDIDRIPAVDLSNKAAQELADNHLKKVWYDGFTGSFKANIEPYIEHGYFVQLIDPRFGSERDGKYVVERVVKSFSPTGFWQDVYLNTKITF